MIIFLIFLLVDKQFSHILCEIPIYWHIKYWYCPYLLRALPEIIPRNGFEQKSSKLIFSTNHCCNKTYVELSLS